MKEKFNFKFSSREMFYFSKLRINEIQSKSYPALGIKEILI